MTASPTSAAHMTVSARKLFDAASGSSDAPPRDGDFVQLPGKQQILVVDAVSDDSAGGLTLYLEDPDTPGTLRKETLSADQLRALRVVRPDGTAPPPALLAGLWGEWILNAARTAASSALASAPLDPYPHQMSAVYGRMLPQPQLRFLLADEPGTGKTIMSGLWLRETQRLGTVKRALVVCPAHLVHKWIEDFDRFFGGGLREVTAETVRQQGLSVPGLDTWVVSLNLAAANPSVLEALHPDTAGWDAVIFDEAHRMTPTAATFHRVGQQLATVPNAVLLTATPHRGDEWFFSELMHLVDPDIFPTSPRPDRRSQAPTGGVGLRPGPLHFLRRMKEQLVDFDNRTPLFKDREAHNIRVPLNSAEQRLYGQAQDLVERFFPQRGRQLAAMVYGKRAASSLHSLAETLRRRSEQMGTADRITGDLDIDDVEHADAEERVASVNSVDARAERREIKTLLADINELLNPHQVTAGRFVPSKWTDLIGCLNKHGITPGEGQAVVFTEFADTATWLTQRLTEEGFTAEPYTGALTHTERAKVQAKFQAGGFQVIVTTDAGNEGIDLQAAAVLINWDVPWSLVRLEQRMGRIHRIGQRDKVWLYNLVASGTREGDAHQRLLDRLVEAANELGGQMFDSLNAILERTRTAGAATEPDRLMRLFYEGGSGLDGDWPTIDAIRAARDAHFAEMRALASDVDFDEADTAARDDRLGRVNPIIVERFLDRADKGGLLTCEKVPLAEHGFYYLSADHPQHGWTLPEPLAPHEATLVAARADARQQAAAAGKTRASEAVMLGPADPALRQLAEGLRRRLAAEAIQGATLCDETSSVDYTLFVHECAITEGTNNGDRQQRPRRIIHSQLVRVDADDTARTVSWDALANLGHHPTAEPRPLAPATVALAGDCASAAADRERERRAGRLDAWAQQLTAQLNRLPEELTHTITDRSERLRRRQQITAAVDRRIQAATRTSTVTRGDIHQVVWAHVTGTATPPADPAADLDDFDDPDSEEVSMRHVTDLLNAGGWHVTDVSQQGRGYDLHAVKGPDQRCVEVKGRRGSAASVGVSLTGGELLQAAQLGDDYWLYVIDHCEDGTGHLFGSWPNPAITFAGRFQDVALVRLAGGELKAALPKVGEAQ